MSTASDPEPIFTEHLKFIKKDQNIWLGLLGGLIMTSICAMGWALITIITGYQVILMALVLGFLVGTAMRISGRGVDLIFGLIGGWLALTGCIMGNLLSAIGIIAKSQSVSFFEAITWLDLYHTFEIMQKLVSPIDLMFYGLATWVGYKFSFRSIKKRLKGSIASN
ncbi:MAG: hypothetical protein ACNS62_20885 [Candidatus Cyclobacteriaceae bacterium M3_2C_046]